MRRPHLGLLGSAIALLAGCGASTPPLVFDSTTRPAPITAAPRLTTSTPTASSPSTAPPQTTASVAVSAEAPPEPTDPPTTPSVDPAVDTTPVAEPATTTTAAAPAACATAGCSGPQLVEYETLTAVPQLGEDPVRGSGCGLADPFGNSMRDGLYYGLLYPRGGDVSFDVACAYYGDAAVGKGAAPGPAADFYVVNVGERERSVPLAADFVYRVGTWTVDGLCVDAGPIGNADWATATDGTVAWLNIVNGTAIAAVAMCTF